jgi:hypothetical protein
MEPETMTPATVGTLPIAALLRLDEEQVVQQLIVGFCQLSGLKQNVVAPDRFRSSTNCDWYPKADRTISREKTFSSDSIVYWK